MKALEIYTICQNSENKAWICFGHWNFKVESIKNLFGKFGEENGSSVCFSFDLYVDYYSFVDSIGGPLYNEFDDISGFYSKHSNRFLIAISMKLLCFALKQTSMCLFFSFQGYFHRLDRIASNN